MICIYCDDDPLVSVNCYCRIIPEKTEAQQLAEIEHYREEGRKARRAGLEIAHLPGDYFPLVGTRPFRYVSADQEWINGWREEDAASTQAP